MKKAEGAEGAEGAEEAIYIKLIFSPPASRASRASSALFPMPYAPCPMPIHRRWEVAQCPMPNSPYTKIGVSKKCQRRFALPYF